MVHFSTKKYILFLHENHVMGTHLKGLAKKLPSTLSTLNIFFFEKYVKYLSQYSCYLELWVTKFNFRTKYKISFLDHGHNTCSIDGKPYFKPPLTCTTKMSQSCLQKICCTNLPIHTPGKLSQVPPRRYRLKGCDKYPELPVMVKN